MGIGTGSGPAADEVLRGEGKVSGKNAKRQAARADTAERFPEVGKAIDEAEANTENIDTLAKVTENMSPGELERMNAIGTEIASYASSSSPAQFARYIERLVANIKDPLPGAWPHEAWPTGPPDGEPGKRRRRQVSETWEGDDIEPATVQRLVCDADLYAILIDKLGMPTAVGRRRLQLRALYDKCPLDGATPFARCEIHHVNVFFEDGGDTGIKNLVPLSAEWHHKIHDRKWTLKMGPDRELRLWRPDGTHERTVPPPVSTTRRRRTHLATPGPRPRTGWGMVWWGACGVIVTNPGEEGLALAAMDDGGDDGAAGTSV